MLGGEEYNQATAQSANLMYAAGSSKANQSDIEMMEFTTDDGTVAESSIDDGTDVADGANNTGTLDEATGGWFPQYDGSCDEEEKDSDKEHADCSSRHPSTCTAQSLGLHGSDQMLEEGNIDDIISRLDNIDVDFNSDEGNGYEVYYVGIYKFVYMLSKVKPEESSEFFASEPVITEDTTIAL